MTSWPTPENAPAGQPAPLPPFPAPAETPPRQSQASDVARHVEDIAGRWPSLRRHKTAIGAVVAAVAVAAGLVGTDTVGVGCPAPADPAPAVTVPVEPSP
jgi:hypothetical protein